MDVQRVYGPWIRHRIPSAGSKSLPSLGNCPVRRPRERARPGARRWSRWSFDFPWHHAGIVTVDTPVFVAERNCFRDIFPLRATDQQTPLDDRHDGAHRTTTHQSPRRWVGDVSLPSKPLWFLSRIRRHVHAGGMEPLACIGALGCAGTGRSPVERRDRR